MQGEPPPTLAPLPPDTRLYPPSWRDAAVRRLYDPTTGGVVCAICGRWARRRAELTRLHCDHIVPWSRGGRTTWTNLQLLCARCNLVKGNRTQAADASARAHGTPSPIVS